MRFIVGELSLHETPQPSSPLLLRFILLPAHQATIQLHPLSMVVDVAEAGSAVVVMDVPSYHRISPPVADLNTRSAIVFANMLTNATIVTMIWLATALLHSYGNNPVDPNWNVDSGAPHHLTADIVNLAVHSVYQGPDRVRMSNGTGLLVPSTDASLLCSLVSSFVLKNLLHVPDIIKNLLSVSQFTAENKVLIDSTLTLILSRISPLGKLYCGDNLRMACMSSPWGIITSPPLPRLFSMSVHLPPCGMSA